MPYTAPLRDLRFLLEKVIGYGDIAATERFAEADAETAEAVLTGAARLCEDVLAPLQRAGDTVPARLENGVVRAPPGFAEGYRAIAEGGWVALSAGRAHGGTGLPQTLSTAVNDMMAGACLSLQLSPLLTQGQIEALEAHADADLRELYLPKLIAGEWSGTMNLSEPQAGSDLGAIATKAQAKGDGTYAITGQKIWISWGDADFVENVCHVLLARLPDAPAGTRGLSMFLVPKRLPDESGAAGAANAVRVVGIEEKLGLHGAPTCVIAYEGATGWLIGEAHGGMAAMFTMMNNARLGVGVQGIGVAEAAYQQARAYALDRRQGKAPAAGDTGAIADHADVRRMLAEMKAEVFAARAIALACTAAVDMGRATGADEWRARAAFLTPIVKAHGTDTGVAVASTGIQVHGGMGYVEETGAAQFLRDVRVTPIYEGTNGIQAMDLVGRKLADAGAEAHRLLDEVAAAAKAAAAALPDLAAPVRAAAARLGEVTDWLVGAEADDRFAGATAYLGAMARVLGAHYHLAAAVAEGGDGPRTALARVFVTRLLPEHAGLATAAEAGAGGLYALSAGDLAP